MTKKFNPNYQITPTVAQELVTIGQIKERISHVPLTIKMLSSLRKSARLQTIHYSTAIEGNRLSSEQVEQVLQHKGHFPGRERDEKEVKGYYAALSYVEDCVQKKETITEKTIQTIHALVMSNGKTSSTPTPYRDGQNVIYDGATKRIVYMPPEAHDVPILMSQLVEWINTNKNIPAPIVAAIAHYQFATIHPYFDGNGRTARLLTTLILHLRSYDVKGLYSLEEYYARNLPAYYEAISIGPSHNYYMGRAEADITSWVAYFIQGMKHSFEKILHHLKDENAPQKKDISPTLRKLDQQQRKVLELFQEYEIVTAKQIGKFFGFTPRTSANLCKKWVEQHFLVIVDTSKKGRRYQLANEYQSLIEE